MRRAFFVAALSLFLPALAHADEPPPKTELQTTITPMAGVTFGRWIGVPVTRGAAGVEATLGPEDWLFHGAADVLLEGGQSEHGLTSGRLELGGGVTTKPWWIRAGIGAHVAYAILVRATESEEPFLEALKGNIGGFALGLHANLEVAIPLGAKIALALGARGAAEAYNGGTAEQVTFTLGVRF